MHSFSHFFNAPALSAQFFILHFLSSSRPAHFKAGGSEGGGADGGTLQQVFLHFFFKFFFLHCFLHFFIFFSLSSHFLILHFLSLRPAHSSSGADGGGGGSASHRPQVFLHLFSLFFE